MFAFILRKRGDRKQLADRPRAGSTGSKELRNRQLRNRHLSYKEMRMNSYILSSSRQIVIEEVNRKVDHCHITLTVYNIFLYNIHKLGHHLHNAVQFYL